MSSGQQITFVTKEMIPLIPSPYKESVLNRVKSVSDNKCNRFVKRPMRIFSPTDFLTLID